MQLTISQLELSHALNIVSKTTPGCEYLSKGLHEKEKRLLKFIRRLGYGEITIKV